MLIRSLGLAIAVAREASWACMSAFSRGRKWAVPTGAAPVPRPPPLPGACGAAAAAGGLPVLAIAFGYTRCRRSLATSAPSERASARRTRFRLSLGSIVRRMARLRRYGGVVSTVSSRRGFMGTSGRSAIEQLYFSVVGAVAAAAAHRAGADDGLGRGFWSGDLPAANRARRGKHARAHGKAWCRSLAPRPQFPCGPNRVFSCALACFFLRARSVVG